MRYNYNINFTALNIDFSLMPVLDRFPDRPRLRTYCCAVLLCDAADSHCYFRSVRFAIVAYFLSWKFTFTFDLYLHIKSARVRV